MNHIKNIIFDLGGVFLDVDYHKTKLQFEELGIEDFDKYFMQHHSNPLFANFEKGLISNEDFFDGFRKETHTSFSDEQITFAWNAMLGDFFPDAVDWLLTIKHKYRVFLFSNTNQVHHDAFIPKFSEKYNLFLDDLFTKAYYSHKLNLRKPTIESFQAIINEQGIIPNETLFIDDTEINIIGAKQAGLEAVFLKKPMKVNELGL